MSVDLETAHVMLTQNVLKQYKGYWLTTRFGPEGTNV